MPLPIWAKNILFLLVYMISGLILAIIIEDLLSGTQLMPLNTALESGMVAIRTPLLTTIIVWVTRLANPFLFATGAVVLSGYLISRRDYYQATLFLTSLTVTTLSLTLLKNYLQIQRPVSDLYHVAGWSFPSGHATLATAFFFLLTYIFFNRVGSDRNRFLLIGVSVLGTLLTCFSRVYLGAHWTLDVIAGIALGLLSVSFTVLLFNLIFGDNPSLRKRLGL